MDILKEPLGWILNLIFNGLQTIGFANAALCVVVFTIIIKAAMIPINYKQQKSQKLMNLVQPEIKKITDKYKNKKDSASMARQQSEMQAVYDKYGASPTGGCLPMLITLFIVFSLYKVVYNIYLYIPYIENLYTEIAEAMIDSGINFKEVLTKYADATLKYKGSAEIDEINKVLNSLKPNQWAKLAKEFSGSVNDCSSIIKTNSSELIKIHSFIGGLNIKYAPTDKLWPGILVPIFAFITQVYSINQMSKKSMQSQDMKDNPAMQSMMVMNKVMPLMSFIFCLSLPIGVGIYWIISSLLQIVQQFVFDKKLSKIDVDELVKENIERASKKKKKPNYLQRLMEAQEEMDTNKGTSKSLKDYAHLSSRNYSDIDNDSYEESAKETKPGSISSYANIMKSNKSK